MRGNGGFGFVTFSSNLQVKRCILTSHFKGMIMENLSPEERINSKVLNWNVTEAPSQSDIIWQNIYEEKNFWLILIVNVIFFVTFCIFFNPQTIVLSLYNIFGIDDNKKQTDFILSTLQLYLQPIVILTFNAGIIPVLVDLVANLEGHKTKSKRQVAIMKKNFFFQIMNTIFVPLTVSTSIQLLLSSL